VNPTWQVLVSKPDDLRELTSRLQKQGVGAKVKSISQVNQEELLTGRQKEILATAISLGYYDFPRKISLTALSDKVGIRPSTLSEVLRSAERKIIENVAKSIRLPVYATGQTKE
jgi:predicted DNA binding protein